MRKRRLCGEIVLETLQRVAVDYPNVSVEDFDVYSSGLRHPSARFYEVYPYSRSRCLGIDTGKYFPWRNVHNVDEICNIISKANGFPVLAHPGWSFRNFNDEYVTEILPKMKYLGIAGVECFHPTHSKKMNGMLRKWCEEHKMLVTGGSDYHGKFSDNNQLAGLPVDELCIAPLLERIEVKPRWN